MPSILYITQVHIESGAIRKLAEECQRHGIHKPLVVTDMGIRQRSEEHTSELQSH